MWLSLPGQDVARPSVPKKTRSSHQKLDNLKEKKKGSLHLTVPIHKEVFFTNRAVLSGWGMMTDIKQLKES